MPGIYTVTEQAYDKYEPQETHRVNFENFVNVVKVDAESGKSIPYAGAGFKIYDPQGNQVKMTFTYPTPTTIDVFYTDANGSLVTPEKLDYGKGYSILGFTHL